MTSRTLVLLKPDTVRRGLMGQVLARYEAKGLRVVAMDMRTVTGEVADRHVIGLDDEVAAGSTELIDRAPALARSSCTSRAVSRGCAGADRGPASRTVPAPEDPSGEPTVPSVAQAVRCIPAGAGRRCVRRPPDRAGHRSADSRRPGCGRRLSGWCC